MAERRMFAKTIIDSDAFLEMPATSQLLYFHLCMRADDEGFINKPKSIMRLVACRDDDLRILYARKFIIPFESGIVVIKHWKIHNYIRGDRLQVTKYLEEKAQLEITDNQSYTLCQPNVSQMSAKCQPDVSQLTVKCHTQDRLGKDSIDKDNNIYASCEATPPQNAYKKERKTAIKHKYGEYENVLLTDMELEKLKEKFSDWNERIERLSIYIASKGTKYKSHYATILSWSRREQEKKVDVKPNKFHNFEQRNTDYDSLVAQYYGYGEENEKKSV